MRPPHFFDDDFTGVIPMNMSRSCLSCAADPENAMSRNGIARIARTRGRCAPSLAGARLALLLLIEMDLRRHHGHCQALKTVRLQKRHSDDRSQLPSANVAKATERTPQDA